MKNHKGMTLIEVMIAMLVLSIAMIGGISFFTSAYRINYSYMESANRIDHALRFVEKLKLARRNSPTYGHFANMGGTGFTVFFADTDNIAGDNSTTLYYDKYGDLYFYENYVSTKDVSATFSNSNPSIGVNSYFYDIALSSPLPTTYPKTHLADKYSNPVLISNLYGNISGYFGYTYDPPTDNGTANAYIKFNFQDWASFLRSENANDSKSVFASYQPSIATNSHAPVPTIYQSYSSGGSTAQSAYALYYGNVSANLIIYKEEATYNGDDSEYSKVGDEGWEFDSYRAYSAKYSYTSYGVYQGYFGLINAANHKSYEVFSTTDSSVWTNTKRQNESDVGPSYVNTPYTDVYIIAQVMRGKASNTLKITSYKYWRGYAATTGSNVVQSTKTVNLSFGSIQGPAVNKHRKTSYRQSVYVSIYPVETAKAAADIENELTALSNSTARIERITTIAKNKGYKMIKIPYISLYANNTDSTLCESAGL
ncbi:MAG: prepilin-type N-terminal cleavage/methylation domain-containing protein [Endomicrobium sp.]|jgi:prepilin-type N-terminal cleavage/methylation domain-containing protein|nr:prepilin-type N-terminal cleavage/methylation domain-containing protein [Endomicrobium sp.]